MVDFAKKVQKKGAEFLHPGEQVVAAVPFQKPGSFGKQVALSSGGVVGAAVYAAANRQKDNDLVGAGAADLFAGQQCILALTNTRFLAFSQSAISGSPKELLGEWPHDKVVGIDLEKQKLTHKAVVRFTDGTVAEGEIVRAAKPEAFVKVLSSVTG